MKLKVFSIFDSKAQCFAAPFFLPVVGAALRAFGDLADDPRSTVNKHPEDYSLFVIGEFDDSVGVLTECRHENLGNAASFISARNPSTEVVS
jgi:hypothetical protein